MGRGLQNPVAYNFMKLGPRYKLCKRLGSSVFEKCQTQKFMLSEARSAMTKKKKGGSRGGGDYGLQLLEKQKARYTYGLTERQFSRYVKEAMEKKGLDSVQGLIARLEARLDNVAYRLGLAKTRRQARQLVAHGHITVNGRKVTIPSFEVKEGMAVSVREESKSSPLFAHLREEGMERQVPAWLEAKDPFIGTLKQTPQIVATELPFDPRVIIQFYSR